MAHRPAALSLALGALLAGPAMAGPALAGPDDLPGPDAVDAAPLVRAIAQTQATRGGGSDSAVAVSVAGPGETAIIGTAALGGLESYDAQGGRIASTPAGEAVAVDAIEGLGPPDSTVVASVDGTDNSLRLFRLDADGLQGINTGPLPLGFAGEGVCLGRNPIDGALYAYVVGDGGEIEQWVLFPAASGQLDARHVRRLQVPGTVKECAADAHGMLYAMQETTGIWRFNGNPEADLDARIVDAPGIGHLDGEGKGVALFDDGAGRRWLFASDTSGGAVNVYDRGDDDRYLGRFRVGDALSGAAVAEPATLSIGTGPEWPAARGGVLLVTDEDASDYKLLAVDDIAKALRLPPAAAPTASAPARPLVAVSASVESAPARSYGDAADDPAIWANPADPGRSLVVATDKKAGIYVYDMQGRVLQFLPDGKMNNVDLREGFDLGGDKVVLVTASNRSNQQIAIYRLDTQAGRLVDVADGPQPTGLGDPYGLCMYQSHRDGATYVFINGDDTRQRQWRLVDAGNGKVRAELVRDFAFDSQTEGCVADDENGNLFANEEDVALWRMSAEPGDGETKTAVARVADNAALKDDLEGMGLYDLGGGRGYIVVSSQGNDTYAVFDRQGGHAYLGSFAVVADPVRGIDGISETDGLDVSSRNLGPGFEHGAMVAQDGRNVMPSENQNYKYVPWDAIARALGLEVRR